MKVNIEEVKTKLLVLGEVIKNRVQLSEMDKNTAISSLLLCEIVELFISDVRQCCISALTLEDGKKQLKKTLLVFDRGVQIDMCIVN